jgi:hypothetical protein
VRKPAYFAAILRGRRRDAARLAIIGDAQTRRRITTNAVRGVISTHNAGGHKYA